MIISRVEKGEIVTIDFGDQAIKFMNYIEKEENKKGWIIQVDTIAKLLWVFKE